MPREERTKTKWIPPCRINDMERAELEKCAKILNCSISEYIRRAILEKNERMVNEWYKRKAFIESED
jgi:hypothetical protein